MRLHELSQEALQAVTSFLLGQHLCRLWLCGSKSLQLKLGDGGGARKFELSIRRRQNPENAPVWLPMTRFFTRLTSFALVLPFYEDYTANFGELIVQLPATLESLKLRFSTSLKAYLEAIALPHYNFPKLLSLEIVSFQSMVLQKPIEWPQTLVSLHVSTSSFTLEECLTIPIHRLPPSLTELRANSVAIETESNAETRFPNSLTDLSLSAHSLPPLLFEMLPDGLLYLSLHNWAGSIASDYTWPKLPRSLLSLTFPCENFSREYCKQLPQSLTRLTTGQQSDASENWLDVVPPNLTYLENLLPRLITKEVAQKLPRTLKKWPEYKSGKSAKVEAQAMPFLPPHVLDVECVSDSLEPLCSELRSLNLHQVPVSIATLQLQNCAGLDDFSMLPKSLEELTIYGGPLPRPAEDYFACLNTFKITTLHIQQLQGDDAIPPRKWNLFPSTLRSLSISVPDEIPVESSTLLPRHLEQLELSASGGGKGKMQDLSWFAHLPPTLMQLSMHALEFSPLPIEVTRTSEDRISIQFPASLRELTLFIVSCAHPWLLPCLLTSLPSKLKQCWILGHDRADTRVTNADLDHLPSSLIYLQIPKSSLLTRRRVERANGMALEARLDALQMGPSSSIIFSPDESYLTPFEGDD